ASQWQCTWQLAMEQFLGSDELCIFGDALPSKVKTCLLRRSLQTACANILVCPRAWQPVVRVLIVHERRDADNPFLEGAARLCEALHATPVVLTVARSQTEALVRERRARAALSPRR